MLSRENALMAPVTRKSKPMPPRSSEYLSIKAVAAELSVSYRTIYRHIRAGRLISHKVGVQYRIRRSDLNLYLQAKFSSPPREPS